LMRHYFSLLERLIDLWMLDFHHRHRRTLSCFRTAPSREENSPPNCRHSCWYFLHFPHFISLFASWQFLSCFCTFPQSLLPASSKKIFKKCPPELCEVVLFDPSDPASFAKCLKGRPPFSLSHLTPTLSASLSFSLSPVGCSFFLITFL